MRLTRFLIGCVVAVMILTGPVRADELKPAYIELAEGEAGRWNAVWTVSARSPLGADNRLALPSNCAAVGAQTDEFSRGNRVSRQALDCRGGLAGQRVGLPALASTRTDALLRVSTADGTVQVLRLTPDAPAARLPGKDAGSPVASSYVGLGIEHILGGLDHLFFVIAIVLLLNGWRRIVGAVTAFTVAHSVTLAATSLGWIGLPSRPVEAAIALSIVFLAAETVKGLGQSEPRLSQRYPWVVAFGFGLLHGFGFARALAEIGLPDGERGLALLAFNIGVEIGQLGVVALAMAALVLVARVRSTWNIPVRRALSYAIGSVSVFWLAERMVA